MIFLIAYRSGYLKFMKVDSIGNSVPEYRIACFALHSEDITGMKY